MASVSTFRIEVMEDSGEVIGALHGDWDPHTARVVARAIMEWSEGKTVAVYPWVEEPDAEAGYAVEPCYRARADR